MSFYRPVPIASSSAAPFVALSTESPTVRSEKSEQVDNEGDVVGETSAQATSRPVEMRKGKSRAGANREDELGAKQFRPPMTDAERNWWSEHLCCAQPWGMCCRRQSPQSPYCLAHTCTAVNADGERCGNVVQNPTKSRVCSAGWHPENGRFGYVEALWITRQAYSIAEASERETNWEESAAFFAENFPDIAPFSPTDDSSPSTSSQSSSDGSLVTLKSIERFGREIRCGSVSPKKKGSLENQRGWGAFGVDKWWEGKWSHDHSRYTFPPDQHAGG